MNINELFHKEQNLQIVCAFTNGAEALPSGSLEVVDFFKGESDAFATSGAAGANTGWR